MKKYFVVSDVHSFYSELKEALDKAGFDINNEEHILIVNGDLFDRGNETLELYRFIKKVPKRRRVMIKGNHEQLYLKLLNKNFPNSYDYSNGTVRTFCNIAKVDTYLMEPVYYYINSIKSNISEMWDKIKTKVSNSTITRWLQSSEWKDYFELGQFIFTHSFIPTQLKDNEEASQYPKTFYAPESLLENIDNWRETATPSQWEEAKWGCPYRQFDAGLFDKEKENGKVLVVGHWHTSDFNEHYLGKYEEDYSIYYGDNLIAIDACTALNRVVNVLVIEETSSGYEIVRA
jgi:predicted phosphodiesterase